MGEFEQVTMPQQKPGRSKQDYGTPRPFLDAVCLRLGIQAFAVDLAADRTNKVCPLYFTQEDDALLHSWDLGLPSGEWLWLNPPYGDIRPWVEKAYRESLRPDVQVAVLIPASVGANWWKSWVHEKAQVLFLNGRITFNGCSAPYPKDCALLLYSRDLRPSYRVWSWQDGLTTRPIVL